MTWDSLLLLIAWPLLLGSWAYVVFQRPAPFGDALRSEDDFRRATAIIRRSMRNTYRANVVSMLAAVLFLIVGIYRLAKG